MWSRFCFLMKQQQSIMLPTVSYRRLFQGWFCSHFNFHLFHALCTLYFMYIMYMLCFCILCSYAIYEWPEFYVNKDMFCSVNKDFCHLLITFARSGPRRMLILILIQTDWHSNSVFLKEFIEKSYFKKKVSRRQKVYRKKIFLVLLYCIWI